MTHITQNLHDNTIYGSVVAAKTIRDSLNELHTLSAAEPIRVLIEELLNEIKALNNKVPIEQAKCIETMANRADTLIARIQKGTPDPAWYELSLKGITDAAKTLGDIANPVITLAQQLAPLLCG